MYIPTITLTFMAMYTGTTTVRVIAIPGKRCHYKVARS